MRPLRSPPSPPGTGGAIERVVSRERSWSTLLREALLPLAALALCPLAAHIAPLNAGVAVDHARALAALETRLGLHVEPVVAGAVANEGRLAHPIAVVYLLAHLPVTVAVLGWVLLKRPYAWPVLQKVFVLSQGATIALNVAWPCAPPSRIGVADSTAAVWGDGTIDAAHVLQHPFAAMPSGHVAFALVAGGAVAWLGPRPWQRLAGLSWPVTTAAIIVVTGNHFWLDAAAAVPVTGLALAVALLSSISGRAPTPVAWLADARARRRRAAESAEGPPVGVGSGQLPS